jgi:hypothetical protein
MRQRLSILAFAGLLAAAAWSGAAAADDRRSQGLRQQPRYGFSYDHGEGYANSRIRPVTPTRPFFAQSYPRYPGARDYRQDYRNGYREGFGDGYSDRAARGQHHADTWHRAPDDYRRDRWHNDNPYHRENPNYYAPRPHASYYYDKGGLRGGIDHHDYRGRWGGPPRAQAGRF